jgi:DNA-directed RNA polymerase specialized sigma subunit
MKGTRRDIPSSAWESDPIESKTRREQEIAPLIRETLTSKEQVVFDSVYGNKTNRTGAIASQIGVSPSQVSKIKNSIAAKFKMYT